LLTLKAPAKINWFLDILGLRDDGFHEIRSLIQKVTLYDTLVFSPSAGIELRTDAPIPAEDNLVYKAAMLLKNRYDVRDGAMISLNKEIPMGAGLGGGSSDAASALLGLNSLWSLDLSRDELCGIAEKLGSDVPFFLYGPVSLALGRGERIVPRNALKTVDILLVKPSFDISTAWAYEKFSEKMSINTSELTKKPEKVNNIEHFILNIERAELSDLAGNVSNDLESVTIESFPVIAEIKEKLLNYGAAFSLMSGSGSVVFGVFDSSEKAEKAAGAFDEFWTAAVQTIID
jgi:4-diphosphocytidyl-2-C-methyl-D-erythritol kinase